MTEKLREAIARPSARAIVAEARRARIELGPVAPWWKIRKRIREALYYEPTRCRHA